MKFTQVYTLGRYADNLAWGSEPGVRTWSRKEDITEAVNFFLNAIVRRTARAILRTSFEYEPVSITDAISFKSMNHNSKIHKLKTEKRKLRCEIDRRRFLRCKVDGTGGETEFEGVERSFISRSWVIVNEIERNWAKIGRFWLKKP